jgi:uncharacterized protein (TIGR03083 family)
VLDLSTYLSHVRDAVDGIAAAATDNLTAAVSGCPEFDLGGLLVHTGGFCRTVAHRVSTGQPWEPPGTWRQPPADDLRDGPIAWHRRAGAELVAALETSDPAPIDETWAGDRSRAFWWRRAAQELAVHWWDAEHARANDITIDAALAIDGIDEYLGEFARVFEAAAIFDGAGQRVRLAPTDHEATIDLTIHGDHIEAVPLAGDADVTARATASDLLLFLWGRVPPSALDVTGDVSLLTRWQDRIRI